MTFEKGKWYRHKNGLGTFPFGVKIEDEMKKAMIVQPMNGFTDKQITAERNKAVKFLEENGYEVINTFFGDKFKEELEVKHKGVFFLSKSLEAMSDVDAVYFVRGWHDARGCRIEFKVAEQYGIQTIFE